MTTPTPPAPTLAVATDKTSYLVGDTITVTATYLDTQSQPSTLTITVSATDAQSNSVSATSTVTVLTQASELMTLTASDSSNDAFTQVSNVIGADGTGTAVFTTTATAPPAPPAA